MAIQLYERPGAWVRYCPIPLGGDPQTFDYCDALTQNAWKKNPWLYEPSFGGYSSSLFKSVRVQPRVGGLIATIDSFPDGFLYDGNGSLIDTMEYSPITGVYSPTNGSVEVDIFHYVFIPLIDVTLNTFTPVMCNHDFLQTGGAAGTPSIDASSIVFQTTKQTGFTFTIDGSQGDIDWGDGSALEAYDATSSQQTPSYSYASPGTYTVKIYAGNAANITKFNCNNQSLTGELNIVKCTGITDVQFSSNSALTSVVNPPSTPTIVNYYANGTGLSSWSGTGMTLAGDFRLYSCPSLTSVTFPSVAGAFTNCWLHLNDLLTTLDLSNFSAMTGYLTAYQCPVLTTITPPAGGAGVTRVQVHQSALTGTLDLSKYTGSTEFRYNNNSSLTGVTNPTSSAAITIYRCEKCTSLTSLNLSSLTNLRGVLYCYDNSAMTSFTPPNNSSSGTFTQYWVYNNDSASLTSIDNSTVLNISGYITHEGSANLTTTVWPASSNTVTRLALTSCTASYSDMTGITFGSTILMELDNNAMTTTEVNHYLVDFDNTFPGTGTGTVKIAGTNAAPDGSSGGYDGLTAKVSLIVKGYTVTTN